VKALQSTRRIHYNPYKPQIRQKRKSAKCIAGKHGANCPMVECTCECHKGGRVPKSPKREQSSSQLSVNLPAHAGGLDFDPEVFHALFT
jgi:hypothetical protein